MALDLEDWGSLASTESYGRLGDDLKDYKQISRVEADALTSSQHASHGMIFVRKSTTLWELYTIKGLVMMQLRFDGVLGFPGGLSDPGESPEETVNREMEEEINLNLKTYSFDESHHIAAYLHEKKNLVLHFYLMEVSEEDFIAMEQSILNAPEYGIETFGIVRVPMFTMSDGLRGFPAFLTNQFAGNARSELIYGLLAAKLFTESEMTDALKAADTFAQSSSTNEHN